MNKNIITILALMLISMASCHKSDDPNGGENGGNGNNGGGNSTNNVPENAINGKFSINENEQVFFSKGNLLYSESAQTWDFADHQYDYFGTSSFAFSQWIDLFDWNTNGAEHGSLSGWRPLTHQEWVYILDERSTTTGTRFAKGKVAGNNGLIIFPDDWNVTSIELNGVNHRNASFYSNTIDVDTWENTFETNGAVFLPAAGWATSSTQNSGTEGSYWSATQQYPIIFNNSSLQSSFVSLQEVSPFKKFSVRLVYSDGQGGGNESVVTSPIVETGDIIEIGRISAKCGFTVIASDDEFHIIKKGIYCGTTENPTSTAPLHGLTNMSGNFNGEWDGEWVSGLTPNTTYYVRAFALTSDNNTYYGEQKTFTTLPDYSCYINGKFSVSEDYQVYFSQGNLQFQASTYTWRFAENQWDYVGTEIPDLNGFAGGTVPGSSNHLISNDYDGWIDLFAWGTGNWPTFISGNITDFVDWGTRPISNAGGHVYPWRTLTDEEWEYILYDRPVPSGIRFTKATVNNIRGLILLPDDWCASYYQLNNINETGTYTGNVISETTWKDVLEAHGAVFLPCAGKRVLYDVSSVGTIGYYWSTKRGWYIDFKQTNFPYTYEPLQFYYGLSVRLVWCVQDEFK